MSSPLDDLNLLSKGLLLACEPDSDDDEAQVQEYRNGVKEALRSGIGPDDQYIWDERLPDQRGWTALGYAARFGDLKLVKMLLKSGAQVNRRCVNDVTPIFIACTGGAQGFPRVAKVLLEARADTETVDVDGYTPLLATCFCGKPACIPLLLEHGADVQFKHPKSGGTAYDYSAPGSYGGAAGHDPNPKCALLVGTLTQLARDFDHEVVRERLQAGANPNEVCFKLKVTPLVISCMKAKHKTVEVLLEAGAKVDGVVLRLQIGGRLFSRSAQGMTPLYACVMGDKMPPELSGGGHAYTTNAGHVKCVEILLRAGADHRIEAHTETGGTPLSLARKMTTTMNGQLSGPLSNLDPEARREVQKYFQWDRIMQVLQAHEDKVAAEEAKAGPSSSGDAASRAAVEERGLAARAAALASIAKGDALLEAVASLRIADREATAKQLHEALVQKDGFADVSLSAVKRACSKMAKLR